MPTAEPPMLSAPMTSAVAHCLARFAFARCLPAMRFSFESAPDGRVLLGGTVPISPGVAPARRAVRVVGRVSGVDPVLAVELPRVGVGGLGAGALGVGHGGGLP